MVYLLGSFRSPALEMRMSADSWQPEGASLESSCSASSAHGTARTESQRLRLLSCLATSNFKCSLALGGVPFQAPSGIPFPKMRTSADSWEAEGASLETVAQPYLHMALLTQKHREWGCFLALPPPTSNVVWEWGGSLSVSLQQPFSENANVCR